MFSVVLRPALAPETAGLLSLLAGAALAEAASEACGRSILCKWPNDLLAADGGKVAGILLASEVQEGALTHVVMGLGVNLAPPAGIEGAAGLGPDVDPMSLLSGFLLGFRAGYRPDEPGFGDHVVRRWSVVSATLGREVEAARPDGSRVRGRAMALDERGGLVIETPSGAVTVMFGEIVHLR